ncbi:conserved hypothetical protein [Rhodospirillaceae bacterium LM-1]|nr:conserved hypothetical protein [Rhodospirillaceae bacterium LM-1]
MSVHQIHVFISHSWGYSGHYDTLADWIFNTNWRVGQASLNFLDFSVPKNDPIHNAPNESSLKEAIYSKIARSHVIVIPQGMYASYSKWIKKEIESAGSYSKPILAVNPWGQERASSVVKNAATKTVGWNSETVISGIWNLYRGN